MQFQFSYKTFFKVKCFTLDLVYANFSTCEFWWQTWGLVSCSVFVQDEYTLYITSIYTWSVLIFQPTFFLQCVARGSPREQELLYRCRAQTLMDCRPQPAAKQHLQLYLCVQVLDIFTVVGCAMQSITVFFLYWLFPSNQWHTLCKWH